MLWLVTHSQIRNTRNCIEIEHSRYKHGDWVIELLSTVGFKHSLLVEPGQIWFGPVHQENLHSGGVGKGGTSKQNWLVVFFKHVFYLFWGRLQKFTTIDNILSTGLKQTNPKSCVTGPLIQVARSWSRRKACSWAIPIRPPGWRTCRHIPRTRERDGKHGTKVGEDIRREPNKHDGKINKTDGQISWNVYFLPLFECPFKNGTRSAIWHSCYTWWVHIWELRTLGYVPWIQHFTQMTD